MLHIYPNARTTSVNRVAIVCSDEPGRVLANCYGVSSETARKCRKHGVADYLNHTARSYCLPWKAIEEKYAIVYAVRRAINLALDDLASVPRYVLPHLRRDSIWRILRSKGLNGSLRPPSDRPAQGRGRFRDDDLGCVHIDIKHWSKLQTSDSERRKYFLFVAIERGSRSMHLAVKSDETQTSAIAFLRKAAETFPFRLTHALTDDGSCFIPTFGRVWAERSNQYCHSRSGATQTNGMVERFNGRLGSEMLGINVYSHLQLEQLLRGFKAAYNARCQRVLDGKTRTKSSPNTSKLSQRSPVLYQTAEPVRATSPKRATSLSTQSRSYNSMVYEPPNVVTRIAAYGQFAPLTGSPSRNTAT